MSSGMSIADAQADVRTTFVRGAPGQAVSGVVWLASATAATLGHVHAAILILVVGGAFIFPATQLVLRLGGRPASLPKGHPMNALAMQTAFIVPLLLPVAIGATLHRLAWFYPAVLMIVGAHYLPFVFLYGMRAFAVLGAAFLAGGLGIALMTDSFALGGWAGGAGLLLFAVWAAVSGGRG